MNASREKTLWWILLGVLVLLFLLSLSFFIYGNYQADSNTWQLVASSLLLSVPLGLLYFSIGLVAVAGWQKRSQGQITSRVAHLLYRTPRAAAVLIITFITLFSLDVFTGEYGFWESMLAFIIHSLPSIVMAILLVLGWRREWLAALGFLLAGLFFMRFVISGSWFAIGNLLIFVLPLLMIALLFWLNWRWKNEMHAA